MKNLNDILGRAAFRSIKKQIALKLRRRLSINTTSLIANLNIDMTKKQPRVLISYISIPLINVNDRNTLHTNFTEIFQIIRFFISRDFIIDVVDCNDAAVLPKIENVKYDFIFGFGEVFYFMTKKYPNVNNCIYVTENSPDFSNEKEMERINYFYERHRIKIQYSRTNAYFKVEHFESVKNAVVMGIESQFEKYHYKKLTTINPTGIKNEKFTVHCPINDKIKKSFLWFGSYGAVHKGLDILIDIAEKNIDFDLHICGLSQNEEYLFQNTISKCKNIHNHGFVNVNSQEFIDVINSVAFMVFPSCSEAMSTAVLTVARHGVLLLLLLRSSGMDRLGNYAFWLDDFKVEYVEKRMREVSEMENDFLTQKSRELQKYANEEFCLERFTEKFKESMKGVLD
jgi:hypothetical protein